MNPSIHTSSLQLDLFLSSCKEHSVEANLGDFLDLLWLEHLVQLDRKLNLGIFRPSFFREVS